MFDCVLFAELVCGPPQALNKADAIVAASSALRMLFPFSVLWRCPAVVDHLDQCREVPVPAAAVHEALVKLLSLGTHRSVGADLPGGFGGKLQVFQHQRGREAPFV